MAIDNDQIRLYENISLPTLWELDISPRSRYVAKHNEMFRGYPDLDWYGSLSDDMVPVTPGWDMELIRRAGACGIAYANDLYTRRSGAFVIGGDLVRKMGFIFPPVFIHYYGDTTMELLCRELDLAGLQEDIIVEHRHYGNRNHPGRHDQTSKDRPRLADEKKVWTRWLANEWPGLKAKLQHA